MFETHLIILIGLVLAIIVLTLVGKKLGVSSPILQVIAGLVISMIPGLPKIHLDPEMLFVIILPPLLYRAAWNTNLREFWSNRRPIGLHGFGLVIVTAGGIGLFAHWLIPNFSLFQGFLLGSIIAPPDALAATSIFQKLKIPKRIVTILEGESLVNDAASLILFRFAIAAVITGQFSFVKAGTAFVESSLLGVLMGCVIGGALLLIHRVNSANPTIDTIISVATPFVMYIAAEKMDASGVLAVVSGGFLASYFSSRTFNSSARVQMTGVWEAIVFLLNGLAFVLVGLQLSMIVERLNGYSIPLAVAVGLAVSVAAIVIRILWIFAATYLPRYFSKSLQASDPYPGWRVVFLMGWCGMRGVVTLASALTMALLLPDEATYPYGALMVFISFIVVLFTLIFQGLTLPYLVRRLGIPLPKEDDVQQTFDLNNHLAGRVLDYIQVNYKQEASTLQPFVHLRERYETIMGKNRRWADRDVTEEKPAEGLKIYQQLRFEMIEIRRTELHYLRRAGMYDDELIRQKEFELDLEAILVRNAIENEM